MTLDSVLTAQITLFGYVVVIALGLVLVVWARLRPAQLSSLQLLLTRVLHYRTTRLALIMAWWWLGWHFLAID